MKTARCLTLVALALTVAGSAQADGVSFRLKVPSPGVASAPSKPSASAASSATTAPASWTGGSGKKPWDAKGFFEKYVGIGNQDRPLTLVSGGKSALWVAGQSKPAKVRDDLPTVTLDGRSVADHARSYYFEVNAKGTRRAGESEAKFQPSDFVDGESLGAFMRPADKEAIDASTIQSGCGGLISRLYDYAIWVDAGTPNLRVYATADDTDDDLTLVLASPSGQISCNDDAVNKREPRIDLAKPASGMYSVWIASPRRNTKYSLHVTSNLSVKLQTAQEQIADWEARHANDDNSLSSSGASSASSGGRNSAPKTTVCCSTCDACRKRAARDGKTVR